jgi:hypothetical protein
MPAPAAAQIQPIAEAALSSAELKGEAAPNLARAIAETTAAALALFLGQMMVMPGIAAAAPPPAGSGSTVGPGMLAPPPLGGPVAAQIRSLADAQLAAQGIRGEYADALAAVLSNAIAQGILLFTSMVQVAPGIAVAGFVTTAPGRLM